MSSSPPDPQMIRREVQRLLVESKRLRKQARVLDRRISELQTGIASELRRLENMPTYLPAIITDTPPWHGAT